MNNFCDTCGLPLKQGQRFCPGCGTMLQGPTAQSPSVPLAPAERDSSTPVGVSKVSRSTRIIFFLASLLLVLAALAIGSAVYVGHRVKQRAEDARQAYRTSGIDKALGSLGAADAGTPRSIEDQSVKSKAERDPCSFLTKEEAGEALGSPILQMFAEGGRCDYEAAPVKSPSGYASFDMALQIGVQLGDATSKMRSVIGGAGFAAQAVGLDSETGKALLQPVPGIGEEAYFAAGELWFRTGEAFAEIDLSHVHVLNRRAVAEAIARKVLAKL